VAGAEVKEIKEAGKGRAALIKRGQEVLARIRNSTKVVIAAVNGFALGGGCELAMACDVRFASENAKFALPEAKLGLIPGSGGSQLLPRLVGIGRAKYMIFWGDMIFRSRCISFRSCGQGLPVWGAEGGGSGICQKGLGKQTHGNSSDQTTHRKGC